MEIFGLISYITPANVTLAIFSLLVGYILNFLIKFLFPRKDSLKERYPFEHTFILVTSLHRLLDLLMEYTDANHKVSGKKSYILNIAGLPPFVMTNHVDNVVHILKTNYENYGKAHSSFKRKFQGLFGDGIFNADGQQWYAHRKTSAHLFKFESFKTGMLKTFNTTLDTAIDHISTTCKPFDLHTLFHQFTMESFAEVAFGAKLGCIGNPDVTFAQDFDYCTFCINESFLNPFWFLERYLTPSGWKYFLCLYRINRFAYSMIRERREQLRNAKDSGSKEERTDLLSLYLEKDNLTATGVNSPPSSAKSKYTDTFMPPTDKNLRDVVLNMIIAGRDTTAQALSWTFFRLCTESGIQETAREEVRRVLQETGELSELEGKKGKGAISYAALQRMRYVEAVCMETLRLHPSVPKEAKVANQDDVLPDGTKIRRGDVVSFQPYFMGRDPDNWGETALKFDPTRFIDKPKPSPFIFTAFQAGPRTCLGQNFAILEMKCAVARLLLAFSFELGQEPSTVTYLNSLTLPMKDGMLVKAKPLL